MVHAAAQEEREHGIHVALLIVDATIESPKTASFTRDAPPNSLADQRLIAEAVEFLAEQEPRAYTHELISRPPAIAGCPDLGGRSDPARLRARQDLSGVSRHMALSVGKVSLEADHRLTVAVSHLQAVHDGGDDAIPAHRGLQRSRLERVVEPAAVGYLDAQPARGGAQSRAGCNRWATARRAARRWPRLRWWRGSGRASRRR